MFMVITSSGMQIQYYTAFTGDESYDNDQETKMTMMINNTSHVDLVKMSAASFVKPPG